MAVFAPAGLPAEDPPLAFRGREWSLLDLFIYAFAGRGRCYRSLIEGDAGDARRSMASSAEQGMCKPPYNTNSL